MSRRRTLDSRTCHTTVLDSRWRLLFGTKAYYCDSLRLRLNCALEILLFTYLGLLTVDCVISLSRQNAAFERKSIRPQLQALLQTGSSHPDVV